MEIVILAALTALGKFIVLWKLLGPGRMVRLEKWIDLAATLLLPLLFLGTFSGALLAVFSGLWLSLYLRFLALFVKPTPLLPWKKPASPSSRRRSASR